MPWMKLNNQWKRDQARFQSTQAREQRIETLSSLGALALLGLPLVAALAVLPAESRAAFLVLLAFVAMRWPSTPNRRTRLSRRAFLPSGLDEAEESHMFNSKRSSSPVLDEHTPPARLADPELSALMRDFERDGLPLPPLVECEVSHG
jgi:hypothetical protein